MTLNLKYLFPLVITCHTRGEPLMSDAQLRDIVNAQNQAAMDTTTPAATLVELGEQLFHDPSLSSSGTVACASCHQKDRQFSDARQIAMGIAEGSRHTPPLINLGRKSFYFWDGRADNLVAQALGPLENPREHGSDRTTLARTVSERYVKPFTDVMGLGPELAIVRRLAKNEPARPRPAQPQLAPQLSGYAISTLASTWDAILLMWTRERPADAFAKRFLNSLQEPGAEKTYERWESFAPSVQESIDKVFLGIGIAISAYEILATQVEGSAAEQALSEASADAVAGAKIFFGKGQCVLCHRGPDLSDGQFHNLGIGKNELGRALGLAQLRLSPWRCDLPPIKKAFPQTPCEDKNYLDYDNLDALGAIQTPALRKLRLTAPYMHDGSLATLRDVVDFYNTLPRSQSFGHREQSLKPLNLNRTEERQLEAFLERL